MEKTALPPELDSLLRHILQFASGILATHGYIDGSYQQLYIGLGMSAFAAAYGFIKSRRQKKLTAAAVSVATDAVASPEAVPISRAPAVVLQKIAEKIAAK